LAFALGVISEDEYSDLELLRKIRNDFAHSIEASFGDQSVTSRCQALKHAVPSDSKGVPVPRAQFLTAAACLTLNLVNRPHYVAQERLTHKKWKY
jgi:mannitol operon repressor